MGGGKKTKKNGTKTGKQQKKERLLRQQQILDRPAILEAKKIPEKEKQDAETRVHEENLLVKLAAGYPISDYCRRAHRIIYNEHIKEERELALQLLVQGCESGCVPSMVMYGIMAYRKPTIAPEHLALPWLLEAAIRGHTSSIGVLINQVYDYNSRYYTDHDKYLLTAFRYYWAKTSEYLVLEKFVPESTKQEIMNNMAENQELRNDIAVDPKMMKQLAILEKYHAPHAVKIAERLIVNGERGETIAELQLLRTNLGLSRPRNEYEELITIIGNTPQQMKELLGRKENGTVHIGSTPNII